MGGRSGLRRHAATAAATLLASGWIAAGAAALDVDVTVPGIGGVSVTTPSVTVPPVQVPAVPPSVASLPTPSLPTPSLPTPSVPTPSVPTPSVPVPSAPTPSTPSAPGVTGGEPDGSSGSGAPSNAPAPSDDGASAATEAGGGSTSGSSATTAARPDAATSGGSRTRARERAPAASTGTGTPPRREGGRHDLARTVARLRQCLDDLDGSERRVLALRSGVGPGAPLTRPQVARRLDLGLTRTGRIEHRGLRRLHALADAGACGAGASTAHRSGATGTLAVALPATGFAAIASDGAGRPRSGVGGVVAHGGDGDSDGRSGLGLPPPIGGGGEANALIALALLAAVALLVRWELRRR